MSGLNLILAKGSNNFVKINSILLRNRCRRYVWTTDISKLYNRLVLKDTALPYGLFLYHQSLDTKVAPEVYVMTSAWYGVVSSGNQSGFSLEEVCSMQRTEFPLAYKIVQEDKYVDDIFSGSNSKEEAKDQVSQVESAFASGSFSLKYFVHSGEKPAEDASND